MKTRKFNHGDEAAVDMTPMLDIVFIMLIFFIVTSTFIKENGFDLSRHQNNENTNEANKSRAIVLQLCADNQVYIDERAIDMRAVRANVERKLADDNRSVVIVAVEQDAATGSLVTVMDQARAAKAPVSIAPEAARCERPASPV